MSGPAAIAWENTIAWQRRHWREILIQEAGRADWQSVGCAWGDPQRSDDPLGDYASVLGWLRSALTPASTVVEIGSWGGKWTQYMLDAHEVICVDLFPDVERVLSQRFGRPAVRMYVTEGDEMRGVASVSADVVFSMDSLVRAPLDAIAGYLQETKRILRPSGRALIHLPFNESPGSVSRGFSAVSRSWLEARLSECDFHSVTLDARTVVHGVLVEAFV